MNKETEELIRRIDESYKRVVEIISGQRAPAIRIPASQDDDDVFISETLRQCRAALERMQKDAWIPVSEREPEEGQSVAFVVTGCSGVYKYMNGMVLGGWYNGGGPLTGFSIPGMTVPASHWMPLPNPPAIDSAMQGEQPQQDKP